MKGGCEDEKALDDRCGAGAGRAVTLKVAAAAAKLADESRKMEQASAEPARYKQLLKELKGRACQGRNSRSFRQ